ncbi:hypothetical protein MUO66_02895 [Candidatus Bathyarchaeota archaeon]|nr:hypothetical protein [Candidatus Bathyarchaeota archaeon]
MTIVGFLHILSILIIMVPSNVSYSGLLFTELSNTFVIITWFHVSMGFLAIILGIFLVVKWKVDFPLEMSCVKIKRLMKPLMILWILALFLGIAFYVYGYWL